MFINRVNYIYFSPTWNTKKIIYQTGFAISVSKHSKQINLTKNKERNQKFTFNSDELVVIAMPSYGGRLPNVEPQILNNLRGNNTPIVILTVYGSYDYGDALLEARNVLTDNNFICIAAATFPAQHAIASKIGKNRPDQADVEMMKIFGQKISEKLNQIEDINAIDSLELPGNYPYRPLPTSPPISPITNDKCVLCMLCYRWCPMDAIATYSPNETDVTKCIRCHGCIRRCPVAAREIVNEGFVNKVESLENSWDGVRKEPEIFI